jgi:hypothetical protein
MKIINAIRNIFNIRSNRTYTAAGAMPQFGSSIVLGNLRFKLKHPINVEQWHWFSKLGWRTIDMRTERRKYICIPDKVLMKLLDADRESREVLYQQLVVNRDEASEQLLIDAKEDDSI